MKYYIKERHNPQFKYPYYIECGKISKKDADKMTNPIYGYNVMLSYKTEQEYNQAIAEIKSKGLQIHK